MNRALEGLRVLDASRSIAGSYCTKLLHDLGADVLKLEPPGGDRARALGPFPQDVPDPEKSGFFHYLNGGKRSCLLDFDKPKAIEALADLASRSDVLVESFAPRDREKMGLAFDRLSVRNPSLVFTSITPFGLTGPLREWQTEEIVEWALGGYMYFGGDPRRSPLMIPGHQADFHAGMHSAFATLVAVHHARVTGQGQEIEVSHWESVLSDHAWLSVLWTHCGAVMQRRGADFLRCTDGWVYIFRGAFYNPNLFILIERPEFIDDPRWNTHPGWITNAVELWPIVEEWTGVRSKHEVVAKAQELKIAATPINTVADLAGSAQLAAREWFSDVEHPTAGMVRVPGPPYRLSSTPARAAGPAPLLGQDTEGALSGRLWPESRPATRVDARVPASMTGNPQEGPLAGLKVIEVTANWAGPLTGRLFGDLGAEVIKVEIASRPATRVLYYAGNEPAKYAWNRSGYFNKMNRNKLGISLDIAKPSGKQAFLKLIERADIFVENNSPRVVRNLGITYEDLKTVNPGLIMVSESGFGATGPERDYVAFGTNIETSCGLASIIGYGPGEAFRTGSFYADPVAGTHSAVAAIAALLHREKTGAGQWIDLALQESAAAFLGEFLMDYLLNSRVAEPRANRHPRHAPQGCYPCMGDDLWLVICVRSDEEWQRFCATVGHPEWSNEFATGEDRHQHHDALDELISGWTREQDHWEAARILQAAGVPAAPVLTNWELVSNQHLFERGFYVPIQHPEAGVFPYPGFPWKFSHTPGAIRMPAPMFAEHSDTVFRELLGLSPQEIEELHAEGAIDTEPVTPVVRAL